MSVAAVMLVRDEADIIEPVLRHLFGQVDHVIVADNLSSDGTSDILADLLREERPDGEATLELVADDEVGYWQSRKTTALAQRAFTAGHTWVVPCDADEIWYAPNNRTLKSWLEGVTPDVQFVTAELYNHFPSAADLPAEPQSWDPVRGYEFEPNPVKRIGFRKRERGTLPKVACRLRPDLVIHAGNHSASTSGTGLATPGLTIRHFSWRTREQYLRKIRAGEAAYAATDLPPNVGEHWRMWADHDDETVMEHFDHWFYSPDPYADSSLIYDPAPVTT